MAHWQLQQAHIARLGAERNQEILENNEGIPGGLSFYRDSTGFYDHSICSENDLISTLLLVSAT